MKIIRSPLVREEVYDYLRGQLMCGGLEPAQMLRVQDLAAELDVSKTPIHNALGQLVQDGLLESLPRGFRVRRYTLKEALDTYLVRERVEGLSARLAATQAGAAEREGLRRQLDLIRSLPPTDFAAHIQADLDLHNRLAELSNNDALVDLTRSLTSRMLGFRVLTKDANSNRVTGRQHERIVNAVLAGEANEAEAAMLAHIGHFTDVLKKRLAASDAG